ncbi:MAG: DUF58 domain-containing protein [Thermoplasmata archaeon]
MAPTAAGDGPRLSPTPRTWGLFSLAGFLAIVAVATRDPLPLFAAVPLLLAPIAVLLIDPGPSAPLPIAWTEEGSEGTVDVAGTIELPRGIDPRDIETTIYRPTGLTDREPPRIEAEGTTIRFRASWRAAEPILTRVLPPRVRWRDVLGLMERPLPVEDRSLPIERFPPEVTRLGDVHLRRTILLPGDNRSRTVGESGEFFGLRPELPGDSPRRINWRAWARTGRRYVNEFQLERTGDVLLFVDARPTSLGPEADRRLLGIMRAAAIGLAGAFLHDKARVGLAVFGEFVQAIPLASGRTQRYRIRETLLGLDVAAQGGPVERGAVALRRQFSPGVTTIVLSSLADDANLALLVHLRRRGFPPIVLSPSPTGLVALGPDLPARDAELVLRIARLVRRQQVARAWRDAPVVDWAEYWSLAGFARFLEQGLGGPRRA